MIGELGPPTWLSPLAPLSFFVSFCIIICVSYVTGVVAVVVVATCCATQVRPRLNAPIGLQMTLVDHSHVGRTWLGHG